MTEPHNLSITHEPLDGPGIRVSRPGGTTPNDVVISTLNDIISGLSDDFDRLDGKPDRDDLIHSLRSVIAATRDLAQFTLNVHRDIADGSLNYPPDAFDQ
ncbi:hypothetical protein [Microbacterium sp. NPDC089188]|uniref:hypothetical protein n=1 Tax=Microbacterium sp. NPDC089188 TaxID=3154971 RepID=UPI00341E649E